MKTRMAKESLVQESWWVYMLRCADGTLYTGMTNNLARRCRQHNAGKASRYTRCRLPIQLVFQESQASRSQALKREAALKGLSRRQKLALIRLAKTQQKARA